MTNEAEDLTSDALSREGAEAWARKLKEKYQDFPHFQVAVYQSSEIPTSKKKSQKPVYVVRTNMVNGYPPNRPTPIKPLDAVHLSKEVAA